MSPKEKYGHLMLTILGVKEFESVKNPEGRSPEDLVPTPD
jgi:hypothetical protein